MHRERCRAFTAMEAVVALVAVVVLFAIGAVVTSVYRYARSSSAQLQDAEQVHDVQRAFAIWAAQNAGMYPLPSVVDAAGATVAGEPALKNTTANIMSLLIYHGGVLPHQLVSVEEANGRIRPYEAYDFDEPSSAVRPGEAAWDPAFAADFTSPAGGHVSYAHIPPAGPMLGQWRSDVPEMYPVVGNRGPEVKSVTRDANGRAVPRYALTRSNTFLIHGRRDAWEGNVAYNDGHVNFETRTDPEGAVYKDVAGKKWSDCLFFDEPDDANGTNAWLSIWTTAGDAKGDFTPIWD